MVKWIAVFVVLVGSLCPSASWASPDTREVVTWGNEDAPGTVVIHTGERKLYFVLEDHEAIEFDVAVGRDGKQWFGKTHVTSKAKNPTWYPPASILRENPRLPREVPPGPKNPLGIRAIYLADDTLRIHGTNVEDSVGHAASHGCFRMRVNDLVDLYEMVQVGADVLIDE